MRVIRYLRLGKYYAIADGGIQDGDGDGDGGRIHISDSLSFDFWVFLFIYLSLPFDAGFSEVASNVNTHASLYVLTDTDTRLKYANKRI